MELKAIMRSEKADKTEDHTVGRLASKALSVLAARRTGGRGAVDEARIGALVEAARSDDPQVRRDVVAALVADGVSPERICDTLIPEAARRMGDAWCNDEMSFAAVSIGTARLQALLRELLPGPGAVANCDGGRVVVMVLSDACHTLGAMVLTGQLRRMGVSVKLMIGCPVAEVAEALETHEIDGVLISAPFEPDWNALSGVVEMLRFSDRRGVTIVLGGGVVEHGPDEVRRRTGADAVTCDPATAIEAIERAAARRSPP